MKMLLIHENLWSCIDGYPDGDSTSEADRKRNDKKAWSKIGLSVNPSVYSHVRDSTSAKEAWQNLAKAFEDSGLSGRLTLLRKLCSLKRENFDSMEAYITEVLGTSQRLSAIKYPLDDEFLAVIMLNGLPSEYNPLIMALENSGSKITSDLVKSKLINEPERHAVTESALFTKRPESKKSVKCHHCHEVGHIRPQCPKLKAVTNAASDGEITLLKIPATHF